MAELDGIRLDSTTDTPEQVNEALGIQQTPEAETPNEPESTAEPEQEAAETDDTPSEPSAATAEAEPTSDDEADDTDEPDEAPDDKTTDEEKPRRPRRRRDYQRRINELVAARNQEREAREALERRLAALEQRSQQANDADAEPDEPERSPDGKPDPEAYDNYDDYVDALTQWRAEQIVEQREQAREEREREAAAAREQEARARTWTEKVESARQKYDDWDDIFEGEQVSVTQPIGAFLEESEVGADLLRHLYLDPDLMERLSGQSVIQVAKELGRIETTYLNGGAEETAEPEPSPSPAATTETRPAAAAQPARARPEPINPVTQATSTTPKDPSEMDYEEFVKWRDSGGGR